MNKAFTVGTFAIVLLLHLGAGIAVAQQPKSAESNQSTSRQVPTLDPDILLYPVTLGMSPSSVERSAERQGWEVVRRQENSLHLQKKRPQASVALLTVGFLKGGAHWAMGTIQVLKDPAEVTSPDSSSFVMSLRNRAYEVIREGERTIYLSRTSDGWTMRTIWTQVSETEAKIEATVE